MHILLVIPQGAVHAQVSALLGAAGHTIEPAATGQKALLRARDPAVELLLCARELPDLDGVALCERARQLRPALPILMLTAPDDVAQRVEALSAGADDCLAVPFPPSQMVARVHALERRARLLPPDPERIEADGCVLDLSAGRARMGEGSVDLTAREVGLLRWLHRHRGRVLSRGELLQQVWGLPPNLETRTVDMTIANLRRKIERDPERPRIIISLKGIGYGFGL